MIGFEFSNSEMVVYILMTSKYGKTTSRHRETVVTTAGSSFTSDDNTGSLSFY